MLLNVTPIGIVAAVGTFRLMVEPSPTCPFEFVPQQNAAPDAGNAQLNAPPFAMVEKVTPTGMVDGTGVVRVLELPLPIWPPVPSPQQ
jgi:hypothetical protein